MKRFIVPFIMIAEIAIGATAAQAEIHAPDGVASSGAGQIDVNDWPAMEALAAKAYGRDPTLTNEFNLAVAYAHTGRNALAIPLLVDVAANGKDVEATAMYRYQRGGPSAPVRFNFADEANRRLAALVGEPASRSRYAGVTQPPAR